MTTDRVTRSSAGAPHYAAIVTPFDVDGAVDEDALRKLCEDLVQLPGVTGLVANANAGEVDALSHEERRRTLRIAVDAAHQAGKQAVAGLAPVPSSFVGAAENAREFADLGADSLLVLGPTAFGRGIAQDAYLAGEYVDTIWRAANTPIIYFLAGAHSGIDYAPAVIEEICKGDGVVALKDTMWSTEGFARTRSIAAATNPDIRVLTGNDNCVLSTIVAGAQGTLLILNCLLNDEVARMYDAVGSNDLATAKQVDSVISPLVEFIFRKPMLKMVSRTKAALELTGKTRNSRSRPPIPELSAAEREELQSLLRRTGRL